MLQKALKTIITALSKLFGNAKKTSKPNYSEMEDDEQLIQQIPIEGTPFTAGKHDGKWYVLMGKYRLNETPFATLLEAVENSKDTSWFRYLQVMQAIALETYEEKHKETLAKIKQKIPSLPDNGQ